MRTDRPLLAIAGMGIPSKDFVTWLARNVLPHEAALRHWLRRRTRLNALGLTVDDIVQETYAQLARMPSVDHIHNPRAYVFRTAHSILLQEIRRSRVIPIDSVVSLDSVELVSQEPSPDRALELKQEMRILASAISSMPKKCRTVFVLKKIHGYSQREIALRLGISENTVETHLARGVKKLMDFYRSSGIKPLSASEGANPGELANEKKDKKRNHR